MDKTMGKVEEIVRNRLLEFYSIIQNTDRPVAYDVSLAGSVRILEWFNRLNFRMGRIGDGELLVCQALSWFQYALLTVNIFPKQRNNHFLLVDPEEFIPGIQLNLETDFDKYSIEESSLLEIPFAGLAFYQTYCLPRSKFHRRWDILNLIKGWEQICLASRSHFIDKQGFYIGRNDLQPEFPPAYCYSKQLRHIFIDLGLEGFFLDKKKEKNAVLFTRNFTGASNIPASLCFINQKGYQPIDRFHQALRFLSQTIPLSYSYPNSGFLWYEFARN